MSSRLNPSARRWIFKSGCRHPCLEAGDGAQTADQPAKSDADANPHVRAAPVADSCTVTLHHSYIQVVRTIDRPISSTYAIKSYKHFAHLTAARRLFVELWSDSIVLCVHIELPLRSFPTIMA
jgi:hypothetical protein